MKFSANPGPVKIPNNIPNAGSFRPVHANQGTNFFAGTKKTSEPHSQQTILFGDRAKNTNNSAFSQGNPVMFGPQSGNLSNNSQTTFKATEINNPVFSSRGNFGNQDRSQYPFPGAPTMAKNQIPGQVGFSNNPQPSFNKTSPFQNQNNLSNQPPNNQKVLFGFYANQNTNNSSFSMNNSISGTSTHSNTAPMDSNKRFAGNPISNLSGFPTNTNQPVNSSYSFNSGFANSTPTQFFNQNSFSNKFANSGLSGANGKIENFANQNINKFEKNQNIGFQPISSFKGVGDSGGFTGVRPKDQVLAPSKSGNKKDPYDPINLEPNTVCGPRDFVFTEINELTKEEKLAYEAEKFSLFKIPPRPPAEEYVKD